MRRLPSRFLLPTAWSCAAVLALTACTGPVLGLLEQEQAEQDVLTIQTDLDGIDLASTRFLAERDGVEYFAAVPVGGTGADGTVCLLIEEGIGVGLECAPLEPGTAGPTIRDSRVTAVLLPDEFDRDSLTDDGFDLPHPNLALRPAEPGA
ncbi:hypothetical protein [Arthrobacter agilis]|uniref:hypothetical protein n=1 Tax=Arthrobacter agilis TaxID=37921 RepID=UPI002788C2F5|nr:hypothetical protein [Arthrobacter agilis]MDQ0733874.1 hypothetical protein [Arthrobacter agilis]